MKKTLIALTALCAPLLANATTIDLGPPDNHVNGEYRVPWTSNVTSLDGQTFSLDLTFTNDEFVRIFKSTCKSFIALPMLILHGTGFVPGVTGSGYSVDAFGQKNSWEYSYSGGGVLADDETFNYALGAVFPMFLDETGRVRTDVDALDFYGLHFEVTLPNSDFEVMGAAFLLAPNGSRWNNDWAIGPHVPDTGSTACLFSLALVGVLFLARQPK